MPLNPISLDQESAVARRRRLYSYIQREELGDDVLKDLLPDGQPHEYEKQLWDYKSELPMKPSSQRPSETESQEYRIKMSSIVKDAVSFYNSYGGYLIIGISDSPRQIIGWDKGFDCDELNKKIKGATGQEIDCHYVTKSIIVLDQPFKVGLLLIPQRPDSKLPAQFLQNAPIGINKSQAYKVDDIYFRTGHECRPAKSADDLGFLCAQRRRQIVPAREDVGFTSILDNNLGARDPGFVKFVGRGDLLSELWVWLCDRYTPVKLLAGLGGVGKTTLAREFAEDVVRASPLGFERVIWLSAKKRFFAPGLNKYTLATRVDFSDTASLLRSLLLQLGINEDEIDPESSIRTLIDEVVTALRIIPSFIIIDDVDSLDPQEEQSELFHTVLQIIGQTTGRPHSPSRVLLTARLSLGAAAGQLMRVPGLGLREFDEYIRMAAQTIGLPETVLGNKRDIERFHKVTEGSPTFASSILRLIELGESLKTALDAWKGSDGDEVRRFAFKKELDSLSDSQVRTLYVLGILGETSQVEVRQITQSNDTLLRDDIGELRRFHLVALESELPGSGPRLRIPEAIRLMSELIKERVRDPRALENECARIRSGAPRIGVDLGRVVHRVIALWRDNKPDEALSEVDIIAKQNPNNGDVKCLLGRAYLRIDPPAQKKADRAFREAYENGCRRPELINLWTESKKLLGDWMGLIEISRLAEKDQLSVDAVYYRAVAFSELGDTAFRTGSYSVAGEHYFAGARAIDDAFKQKQAIGRVPDLKMMRHSFMHNYVHITDRMTSEPNNHIEVWLAVVSAFTFYVRSSSLIRLGVERLSSWWYAVESRERFDATSANQLDNQLKQLDWIIDTCRKQELPDEVLINQCTRVSETLAERLDAYRNHLG